MDSGSYERFHLGQQCGTRRGIKTLAHFARKHQFAYFVVAGQDRLERTRRGVITAVDSLTRP
jgi:hypothetical protein